MPKKNRQRCFVIMPFSETGEGHTADYWTHHFNSFLKPLIEGCSDFEAQRSEPLRGDLLRRIITNLVISPVVVADLTDNNPNVYWELGVRQSFKHGTVTIAQEGTKLFFDIDKKGTQFYNPSDHLQIEDFRTRFKEAIQDCLLHPEEPDSHVLETISGRGSLFEIFRRDEALRRLYALLSEFKWNLRLLKRVMWRVEENKKQTETWYFVTGLFRTPAVELLITNRYLDKEKEFYKLAEEYLDWIIAMNGQIRLWPHECESVEEWFLTEHKRAGKVIEEFKVKVSAAHRELAKKL